MTKTIDALVEALENLLATVRGECPALLDEIRDGDGRLSMQCDEALAQARAEQAEPVAEGCTPKYAQVLRQANLGYAMENHMLREALQFYADREHFNIADSDAWDTVSGEPQNFWCDDAGTATVEDGTVAAMALRGTPLKDEDDTTTPPAVPVAKLEPWMVHARKLVQWRHCMSYNDSYFGESAGLLKHITTELERLMPEERLEAAHNAKLGTPPAAPVAKLEPLTDADALNLAQNVVANSERPIGAVGLCLLAFRAIEAAHNAKLQTRAGATP